MAEKGLTLLDQTGGTSVAVRDAIEPDNLSNPRLVQRLDYSLGPLPVPIGAPNRGNLTTSDGALLSSLPADHLTNIISCGDKTHLVTWVKFCVSGAGGMCYLTPLWYDNEATPGYLGCSEGQLLFTTTVSGVYITDGTNYQTPIKTWPLVGAPRVSMHVAIANGAGASHLEAYAYVI